MKRLFCWSLLMFCSFLDYLPAYAKIDGNYKLFHGCYGCWLGVSKLSLDLEQKWKLDRVD